MEWPYHWSVRDDGLYIYENGQRIANIPPSHFIHLVAELSEHVRWQETRKEENGRENT
jgi:hypothetical protein